MRIFFLGDIVGKSGRQAVIKNLKDIIKKSKIDFVIVNGENAADPGVGITKKNTEEFFEVGVDVITTGNHVWDQQETMEALLEMLDKTITVEVRSRPPARQGVESLIMRP